MSEILSAFHHLRRRLGQAEQRLEQAGERGDVRRIDKAIDDKKDVENQIETCFLLVRRPEGMGGRQ